jgi:hypothetical protein
MNRNHPADYPWLRRILSALAEKLRAYDVSGIRRRLMVSEHVLDRVEPVSPKVTGTRRYP